MNLEQEQTTYSAKAVKIKAAQKNHVSSSTPLSFDPF